MAQFVWPDVCCHTDAFMRSLPPRGWREGGSFWTAEGLTPDPCAFGPTGSETAPLHLSSCNLLERFLSRKQWDGAEQTLREQGGPLTRELRFITWIWASAQVDSRPLRTLGHFTLECLLFMPWLRCVWLTPPPPPMDFPTLLYLPSRWSHCSLAVSAPPGRGIFINHKLTHVW